jgi:hypothetical protein
MSEILRASYRRALWLTSMSPILIIEHIICCTGEREREMMSSCWTRRSQSVIVSRPRWSLLVEKESFLALITHQREHWIT